jgi:hypothetical protein
MAASVYGCGESKFEKEYDANDVKDKPNAVQRRLTVWK